MADRAVKVLLTNSHSANTGDAAIISAMADHLRCISPHIKITAQCSNPQTSLRLVRRSDIDFHGYAAPFYEGARGVPSLNAFLSCGLIFFSNLLTAALFRASGMRLYLFNRKYRQSVEDFISADVVISVGGGFISSEYGFVRPFSDITMAKLLGKKVVIYPQSIGPFCGAINRLISRLVLGSADLIILRERRSAQLLAEIGIRNTHITADAAFSLSLPKGKKRRGRKPMLIICPREWTYEYRHTGDSYIRFVATLARRASQELDFHIMLLPTTPDDIWLYSRIAPHLPPSVTVSRDVPSPESAMDILGSADFIVSSRMHPLVLGSLSSTPFFAIGWEYKMDELASMFSVPECSIHAASLDRDAENRIIAAIRKRSDLRQKISAGLPSVKNKSLESMELLRDALFRWGII